MDDTHMAIIPEGGPGGGGTEAVEWYGLLQCAGGVLEGQRFIVEAGGMYIGRDPSLSQVAIADNRISKRHVRIIPRDGKVWAIDQNSTNGTFLASNPGVRITEVELKRGDTIILSDGAATFVYRI
jgi:pSer/pThr/pTyr-binding forkhead associated (FHA) protein